MLANVPPCPEPQAASGNCDPASQVGITSELVGFGPAPLWLTGASGGRVYLTGSYRGAPFGLSIVIPTQAGPFDLGDVVVRAAIGIDPKTAQVSVASDPLPTILQGIPLDIRAVNVAIDRERFMFNPTSCQPMSVAGTVTSTEGAIASLSSRFQAAECRSLPFKPSLTATTAKTSRARGASLHVTVRSGVGQANIESVKVLLPKRLPARLATLKLACPQSQFQADPSGCPAASRVGTVSAHTPVLPVPMSGPAYFVSHGNAAFPDLVIVLQGDGVTIELTGKTFIGKGVTSSTFASIPDVPVTRFDLFLPAGPQSALAATGRSLCVGALLMPTTITAQNGAQTKRSTRIATTGCRGLRHKARHPGRLSKHRTRG